MAEFEIHHLTAQVKKREGWDRYQIVGEPEVISQVYVADGEESCFRPIIAALPMLRSVYILCTDVDGKMPLSVGMIDQEVFTGAAIVTGGGGRSHFQFEIPKVDGSAVILVDKDKNLPAHMLVVREVK